MPILSINLIGGIVYFYFQSDPNRATPNMDKIAESSPAAEEEFSELAAPILTTPAETETPAKEAEPPSLPATPIPAIPVEAPIATAPSYVPSQPEPIISRSFTP